MRKAKQIILLGLCALTSSAICGALGYALACGMID